MDGSGNVYVGGCSDATWGSPVRAYTSGNDAFAARLDSSGALAWNTFLGSAGSDRGYGIAVDGSGNAYVAGYSDATWGSPVRLFTAGDDAWAARLDSSGALIWNTFLGGSGNESGRGIAVDGSGDVYVGGESTATWQGTSPPVRVYAAGYDAWAAKLSEPDITVTPLTIDFGQVGVGSSSPAQTVTVTNDGCGTLNIGTVTLGGANPGEFAIQNDNCSAQALAPGAAATLQIVFSPTSLGVKTATLSIPSDDRDENPVNVALNGTGVGQDITVIVTIDFGQVGVGSSSPAQTVTARNDGAATLNIGTVTLGGANPGQFAVQNDNFSGQALNPGASATLEVVFSPTAVGTSAATLSIPSDDTDEPQVDLPLRGTGLQWQSAPPAPAASPAEGASTAGQPGPALVTSPQLRVAYLNINPRQTYAEQPVTISANVVNSGGMTGSTNVALKINGRIEQTQKVSVSPGATHPVKFTVTRAEPGTYTVIMGSQQGSFAVTSDAGSPVSGAMVAIIVMGVLVLLTVVVLLVAFRRPA